MARPGAATRRRGRGRREQAAVYSVTRARRSISADVDSRQVRYLISMMVRTACFVLAVVTDGWIRWAFVAGAVVLPYLAVVFANGGREPVKDLPTVVPWPDRPALESGGGASGRGAA